MRGLAARLPFALRLIGLLLLALSAGSCSPKFNFRSSISLGGNQDSSNPSAYGPATQVVFTREPATQTASGSEIPIQVTIEDAGGRVVTGGADSMAQVSLALTSGSGPLSGTLSVNAVGGVAEFVYKGVNIATLGSGNIVTATKADTTGSGGVGALTGASNSFSVITNNSWYGATATAEWLTTGGQPAAGTGDGMFSFPGGTFVDSSSNLYVVDTGNFRIMKFNSSGVYQGWVGWVQERPTGGTAGCTSVGYRNVTPGWCTGGYGTSYVIFSGIWGDGTYLYATGGNGGSAGTGGPGVFRFNASTGAYMGWTGLFKGSAGSLQDTYTVGCHTLTSGSPTPGWCVGEETFGTMAGSINGSFSWASGITGDGTYLYVANAGSGNIQRITASTGAAAGWIGNLATVGGDGCGSSTGSFTGAWCTDATATSQSSSKADGSMSVANSNPGVAPGIYYNGGSLYLTDTYNNKINQYTAATGVFVGWAGMVKTTPTGGAAGCTTTVANSPTPGWCTGGAAKTSTSINGLNSPSSITGDGTYLYVLDYDNRIVRYQMSDTTYEGWIGAIGTAGAGACGAVGTFTNAWCTLTGTKPEAGSGDGMLTVSGSYPGGIFYSTATGSLWVADGANNRVSSYNASGTFLGWSGALSNANVGWQTANAYSAGADDDNSFAQFLSAGFTDGTNLFVVDNSRIKAYSLDTPTYTGWVGDVLNTPTGGTSGCTTTASGSVTPGWCEGGISQSGQEPLGGLNGSYISGRGVAIDTARIFSDGTYIYSADGSNQINRYDESTGVYAGWIGTVSSTPTGGDPGCSTTSSGNPTPGWCIGGSSEGSAASDYFYNSPTAVYSDGTYLYIVENGYDGWSSNDRVVKVEAATGQFVGWIGGIGTSPTGGYTGCDGAVGDTPGWCTGGVANSTFDTLGGLGGAWDITGDGTYIYVANGSLVNRYNASTGVFAGWIGALGGAGGTCTGTANHFNGGWCTGATATNGPGTNGIGGFDGPTGIYTDGLYLYVANNDGGYDYNSAFISKYVLGTGAFVGWKGWIGTSPTGGDPGCSGAAVGTFTPGWCTGGLNTQGSNVAGAFASLAQLSGAGSFLYVGDAGNFRIDRIGK